MNSAYRELFTHVRDRPGMYLQGGDRYDVVTAFILGCDMGNSGGLLRGFEEWLLQRRGGPRNVHWSGLVVSIAFSEDDKEPPLIQNFDADQHRRAVATLWELGDQFLRESGTLLQTREIYAGFERWSERERGEPDHA
jgi:hypothetical protein